MRRAHDERLLDQAPKQAFQAFAASRLPDGLVQLAVETQERLRLPRIACAAREYVLHFVDIVLHQPQCRRIDKPRGPRRRMPLQQGAQVEQVRHVRIAPSLHLGTLIGRDDHIVLRRQPTQGFAHRRAADAAEADELFFLQTAGRSELSVHDAGADALVGAVGGEGHFGPPWAVSFRR